VNKKRKSLGKLAIEGDSHVAITITESVTSRVVPIDIGTKQGALTSKTKYYLRPIAKSIVRES
jgi:hypothetical protein